MAIDIVSGWTEDVDYILKVDGVALDLTNMTVAIVARKPSGSEITLTGTLTITDAANGVVRFSPAVADIALATTSSYHVRWKVTDSGGKISYFPNAEAEEWTVRA